MSGKGAKGLLTSKTPAQSKDKDKKKPTSRSSRAGLQVLLLVFFFFFGGGGFARATFHLCLCPGHEVDSLLGFPPVF